MKPKQELMTLVEADRVLQKLSVAFAALRQAGKGTRDFSACAPRDAARRAINKERKNERHSQYGHPRCGKAAGLTTEITDYFEAETSRERCLDDPAAEDARLKSAASK